MPTTYNGIGTHYYGRKNRKTRTAVCRHCGHQTELSSYETRLWFVFVFIPVISLGRKRITDRCALCNLHYAMPVRDWETGRQTETAAAMDRFRKEQSAEAALDVHGQLIGFQQFDEAADFRESMLEKFPEQAVLPTGFAAHLEFSGLPEEAGEWWDRAFSLDPELPEVRVGIARRRMRDGQLDEARELLSFLEEPGAEQQFALDPLFELVSYYQQAGQHKSALEILAVLLRAFPQMATDHQIRKVVQVSEKALHSPESILPPLQHSVTKLFGSQYSSGQRWTIGLVATLVLTAVGMVINNEYIRRHRVLTIINDTGMAASVQLDDQPPVQITGMQTLNMAEGTHSVRITGPVKEDHTLDVRAGYWQRWTKNPVWLVNVGGEGILADMVVHYAVHPRPPSIRLITEPVVVREHVDYAFEAPPESLEVGSETAVRSKTTLSWLELGQADGADIGGFYALQDHSPEQAFAYAERKLRRDPGNEGLLRVLAYETKPEQYSRFQTLLELGLNHRPVSIPWHRIYQDLPPVSTNYDALVTIYDELLSREPDNGELLYLRGRFDKNPVVAADYIDRAAEANPELAYVWYSRAYRAFGLQEWKQALTFSEQAVEKGMPLQEVLGLQHAALLALGQHEEQEQRLRSVLDQDRANMAAATLLSELLVMTDRADEAEEAMSASIAAFRGRMGDRFKDAVFAGAGLLAYFLNDTEKCVEELSQAESASSVRDMVLIETGQLATFADSYQLTLEQSELWLPLICSLGYAASEDQQNADIWFQKAVAQLQAQGPRREFLCGILNSAVPSAELIEQLRQVSYSPLESATILISLAQRTDSAEVRQKFLDEAETLMVRRIPPYGLLKKVHAMAAAQP